MHGIISIKNPVGAGFTPAPNGPEPAPNDQRSDQKGQQFDQKGRPQGIAPTVSAIVGAYKSLVANGCLNIYRSKNKLMGKFWQRNYHDHIIRNERSYHKILEYIINNPLQWADDKFYRS